jgi:hypothetical protein
MFNKPSYGVSEARGNQIHTNDCYNLVTRKAAAKQELSFNKPTSEVVVEHLSLT